MLDGLKTVGRRMAILRAMGNLSQKDLARLCNISDSLIENIECGRTTLKKEQAIQIVKTLKNIGISTSIGWLTEGSPLISSTLDFANSNVIDNVYAIMNSTTKLIITDSNDFIKIDSIVLASTTDISKITDEPFIIVEHEKTVFACKAEKSHKKIMLYKEIKSKPIEFNDEMTVYFPSIIIMK